MTAWGSLVPEPVRPERLWVLVAHRRAAVLFERRDRRGLERILEVERRGPRELPAEVLADELDAFGRSIAGQLSEARRGPDALILLAEPRLLGAIRWALGPELGERIRASMIRPPEPISDAEVARYLAAQGWFAPAELSRSA